MNKALGVIPARWSSTRFTGKPLYLIADKPLLQHVWQRCRTAKNLDRLIVATDDMRIAEAAFDWGAEVALTSPRHRSGTDRVAEVARRAKAFAFVLNIQGDEPLLDPRLIDAVVEKLRSDVKIDIVSVPKSFRSRITASKQSRHRSAQLRSLLLAKRYPLLCQTFPCSLSAASGYLWFPSRRAAPVCEVETEST